MRREEFKPEEVETLLVGLLPSCACTLKLCC